MTASDVLALIDDYIERRGHHPSQLSVDVPTRRALLAFIQDDNYPHDSPRSFYFAGVPVVVGPVVGAILLPDDVCLTT